MSRSIACLLAVAAGLAGCQNSTPNLSSSERIGVETTSPAVDDGTHRIDAITTVTQDYAPDQLANLPIGGDCTVQTTDPGRSLHGTIAEVTTGGDCPHRGRGVDRGTKRDNCADRQKGPVHESAVQEHRCGAGRAPGGDGDDPGG